MDPIIIPLYLYINNRIKSSYIDNTNKARIDDQVKLVSRASENTDIIMRFYAINPDIRPIPNSMDLFCISKSSGIDSPTVSVIYDPFNIDQNCIRFLAWLEPVPYTTPLYIFQYGNKTYISFDGNPPNSNYEQVSFSPIFVLTDPRDQLPRVSNGKNNDFQIVDNKPQFLFSGYHGRCFPDPDGIPLDQCSILYTKNILDPYSTMAYPTLLKHLESLYSNNSNSRKLTAVFAGLLIIVFFIVLFIMVRTKTKGG